MFKNSREYNKTMTSKNPRVSPIGFLDAQSDKGTLTSKRFFFLALTLVMIITASQFANAGWLSDLFRGNEVQQSPTPVTATLTVNSPPFVAKIFPVPAGFGIPIEPLQPPAGTGTVIAYKAFVIEDPDSITDIPTTNLAPLVDFAGGIRSPPTLTPTPILNPIDIAFTSCITIPCNNLPGTCPGNVLQSVIWLCATAH